jgi:lycopene beta-cyclase
MGNPIYLLILTSILVISIVVHRYYGIRLFKNRGHMTLYFVIVFVAGLTWDYFSVWQQIWVFPYRRTIGINIGILPIEEYLFFLIVPYFGVTVYKLLEKL